MTSNPIVPITVGEPLEPVPPPAPHPRPSNEEIAAWVLVSGAIVFVLVQHLISALIAGLALYLILDRVSRSFQRRLSGSTARPLALLIVALVTIAAGTGAVALTISIVRHSAVTIPDMMTQMANILDSTRTRLGDIGDEIIPDVLTDADNAKAAIAGWLKTHAQAIRAAGGAISVGIVHVIMGCLLALLAFFRRVTKHEEHARGPLARQLFDKVNRFTESFARIATAQIKISAMNTTLTAIYLLVLLPMFGIRLPFGTTLVIVTFICGLIPVIGNLISNTVITILSLGISFGTAIASLVFLVLIHKLEYLINSHIVGGETDSQAWEILMAIIIGESAFGAGGLVLGPIVYAFVKRELRDRGLD
jgi:predicted PurR-regulated permease PerM